MVIDGTHRIADCSVSPGVQPASMCNPEHRILFRRSLTYKEGDKCTAKWTYVGTECPSEGVRVKVRLIRIRNWNVEIYGTNRISRNPFFLWSRPIEVYWFVRLNKKSKTRGRVVQPQHQAQSGSEFLQLWIGGSMWHPQKLEGEDMSNTAWIRATRMELTLHQRISGNWEG